MKTEIYIAKIIYSLYAFLILAFPFIYVRDIKNHLKEFKEREDVDGIWFGIWFIKLIFLVSLPFILISFL